MRILFVSGTSTGGAARSTDELASRLQRRGHDVATLAGWRSRPRRNQIEPPGRGRARVLRVADTARLVHGRLPRRPEVVPGSPYPRWRSRVPEAGLPLVCDRFRPDVVVVTAVRTPAWRTMRDVLTRERTPCALYLRTEHGFHRLREAAPPDLVVANAIAHADAARAWGGAAVVTIPSVVEVEACRVASTRERVLFVNPVARHGLDVVLGIAGKRPDLPVTVHESTPLDRADMARLRVAIAPFPNVELRRAVDDRRALYRDARVLLVPYQMSNRPRVVLEAQSNRIPVVASDLPALRECVGPGGLLVRPTDPPAAWAEAVAELWDSTGRRYDDCAAAAFRHSRRPEVDPDVVAGRFETEMARLVDQHPRQITR